MRPRNHLRKRVQEQEFALHDLRSRLVAEQSPTIRQGTRRGTFNQRGMPVEADPVREKSLQRVVSNYLAHYHQERNHQGKDNLLLFPVAVAEASGRGAIRCRERLGGLLKYYSRAA